MKTIGLIGGMSWESSSEYYRLINKRVNELLGGFHSCESIMYSVDFAKIEKLQHNEKWDELNAEMVNAARRLEKAGADIIILCTNTMHISAPEIIKNISVDFLHIAEATALEIKKQNLQKVALLGTRFTMEKPFYKNYLSENFDIEVLIPEKPDREKIHSVIYNELVNGEIKNESREVFKSIINKLAGKGAQGVILGCTEIPLLISDNDVKIAVFDTTKIHAEKAVEMALEIK